LREGLFFIIIVFSRYSYPSLCPTYYFYSFPPASHILTLIFIIIYIILYINYLIFNFYIDCCLREIYVDRTDVYSETIPLYDPSKYSARLKSAAISNFVSKRLQEHFITTNWREISSTLAMSLDAMANPSTNLVLIILNRGEEVFCSVHTNRTALRISRQNRFI